MMQVSIYLIWQTQPMLFSGVQDTFQKGDLYCVHMMDGTIHKFPLLHILYVTEYRLVEMPTKR
jgi:hypothetical protein